MLALSRFFVAGPSYSYVCIHVMLWNLSVAFAFNRMYFARYFAIAIVSRGCAPEL